MKWLRWTLIAIPLWPLIILILAAQRHALSSLSGDAKPFLDSLHWFAFQWGPWALLSPLVFFLLFLIPLKRPLLKWHLPWLLITGAVTVILHTAIQALLKITFYDEFLEQSFTHAFSYLFLAKAHIEFLVFLVIASVIYGIRLTQQTQHLDQQNQLLETRLAKRQLEGMRRQLAPHFLFNALNSLCGLLPESSKPHRMAISIGDFLRRVLNSEQQTFSSLSEEIEFTRTYLNIENVRFGERLQVVWDIDRDLLYQKVPNMLLQPLAENAVVHGVSRSNGITTVSFAVYKREEQLCIQVSNQSDQPLQTESHHGSGMGLSFIRSCLDDLYGGYARLETLLIDDSGFTVTVYLPAEAPEA